MLNQIRPHIVNQNIVQVKLSTEVKKGFFLYLLY
jgi:hypothetical protein